MEFEYVGVIVGNDLQYRNGRIITNQHAISASDKTSGIRNYKNAVKADELIRNTYRVLLSRGMKGCFLYCEDKLLADYIKKILNNRN